MRFLQNKDAYFCFIKLVLLDLLISLYDSLEKNPFGTILGFNILHGLVPL